MVEMIISIAGLCNWNEIMIGKSLVKNRPSKVLSFLPNWFSLPYRFSLKFCHIYFLIIIITSSLFMAVCLSCFRDCPHLKSYFFCLHHSTKYVLLSLLGSSNISWMILLNTLYILPFKYNLKSWKFKLWRRISWVLPICKD